MIFINTDLSRKDSQKDALHIPGLESSMLSSSESQYLTYRNIKHVLGGSQNCSSPQYCDLVKKFKAANDAYVVTGDSSVLFEMFRVLAQPSKMRSEWGMRKDDIERFYEKLIPELIIITAYLPHTGSAPILFGAGTRFNNETNTLARTQINSLLEEEN